MGEVLPLWLRSLAIFTGSVVAGTGLALLWTDPIPAGFLILAALIQPRAARSGTWLIWVSAFLLSAFSVPFLKELLKSQFSDGPWDISAVIRIAIELASASLLSLDIALVIQAARRDEPKATTADLTKPSLDWVVWILALALSAWVFWASRHLLSSHLCDDFGMFLIGASRVSAVIVFDGALIRLGVKSTKNMKLARRPLGPSE